MTDITPIADYLAAWQDELHSVEESFEAFYRHYEQVLLATADKNRVKVYRWLNGACVFNAMARHCFEEGYVRETRKHIFNAHRCLEQALWVN